MKAMHLRNETLTSEFLLLGFQNLSFLKLPTFSFFLGMFVITLTKTVECFILAVMSYDRYLAICDPLRYNSIMSARLQYQFMFWSWVAGTMTSITLAAQIYVLQYCGSNVIDHFFCDTVALLELSCSSTYIVKVEDLIIAVTVTLFPFVFICLTYFCIFFTIFRRQTSTGRQKAFSTCSAHLLVVSIFYGSLLSVYGAPSSGYSPNLNKCLSLLYTFLTPLFNPIIYSLRNREIRLAFRKISKLNVVFIGYKPTQLNANTVNM
ncbi:olfactory receptor 5G29-like [Dendropsophus ebraccatus]|uniref:olfactory receptor 5G29-like n=1 Tax=Dendropsophus ebraccatus TaxID=150705 RepID=UPI003831B712